MDYGIALTGLLAVASVLRTAIRRRDISLPCVLLTLWSVSLALVAADARMSTFVFCAATLNLALALIALVIVTHTPTRIDAKIVGGLSLAIMPAHWVMSVTQGGGDWAIYALSCNIVYVMQCLVAGGWLDGLGRRATDLLRRLRPFRRLRSGGR